MNSLETNANWLHVANDLQTRGAKYVLVTVLGARGSTPRDMGTKMIFTADKSFGTIGGGHLEHRARAIADELFSSSEPLQRIERFPLGPTLGQCCGGTVSILFEYLIPTNLKLMLFGAGHVGQMLALLIEYLPIDLYWVDSRMTELNPAKGSTAEIIESDEPITEVERMPEGSSYLLMTHNHQLDYSLLRAILDRGDADYVGLIGSVTKWRRFQMRLTHHGYHPDVYNKVRCPVGLPNVEGKRPMEVAISIAGELIEYYRRPNKLENQFGIQWAHLREIAHQLSERSENE